MQDKNIRLSRHSEPFGRAETSRFSQDGTGASRCAYRRADRRDDPYFFLNFFAKSSSFTVAVVVCYVATRRR